MHSFKSMSHAIRFMRAEYGYSMLKTYGEIRLGNIRLGPPHVSPGQTVKLTHRGEWVLSRTLDRGYRPAIHHPIRWQLRGRRVKCWRQPSKRVQPTLAAFPINYQEKTGQSIYHYH